MHARKLLLHFKFDRFQEREWTLFGLEMSISECIVKLLTALVCPRIYPLGFTRGLSPAVRSDRFGNYYVAAVAFAAVDGTSLLSFAFI